MNGTTFISLLLSAVVAVGCGTVRSVPSREVAAKTEQREIVRIATRTEIVPVTVNFDIPQLREVRRNVRDTTDIIENEWVRSSVTVHPDGSFDHNVETLKSGLEKELEVPVTSSDTSTIREVSSSERETVTVTVTTNVLHWWQKALIWCGAAAALYALIRLAGMFFPQLKAVQTVFKTFLKL